MANFGGRYRPVRLLGEGGMGEVWLACDMELGDRPVAIKIMRPSLLASPQDTARFQREMRLAAKMQHPNIVSVFTTGTHNGVPFLVMEYLQGGDLSNPPPNRDPEHIARIGRDICDALAYAHGLGVVHRDIKPANLFLCESGQVKVTDFGIAKAVSGTRLSATGVLVGTMHYMAPEQWLGHPAAFSNDVWAVGCVLYKLLSGVLPRSYSDPADYMTAAARGDRVTPLASVATVPAWLADAVMAMLGPDPRDRPAAADCISLLAAPASRPRTATRSLLPAINLRAAKPARPRASRHARRRSERHSRVRVVLVTGLTALAVVGGATAARFWVAGDGPSVGQACAGSTPFTVTDPTDSANSPFHGWYLKEPNGLICIGTIMSSLEGTHKGPIRMRVRVWKQGTQDLVYDNYESVSPGKPTNDIGDSVRQVFSAPYVCVAWLGQSAAGSWNDPVTYSVTCGNVP